MRNQYISQKTDKCLTIAKAALYAVSAITNHIVANWLKTHAAVNQQHAKRGLYLIKVKA
jgi:hypothetical protein